MGAQTWRALGATVQSEQLLCRGPAAVTGESNSENRRARCPHSVHPAPLPCSQMPYVLPGPRIPTVLPCSPLSLLRPHSRLFLLLQTMANCSPSDRPLSFPANSFAAPAP